MDRPTPTGSTPRTLPDLEALVTGVLHLVSPPEIHFQLEEAIESPYGSWERVSDIISQDPNLSARLLQLANSAFHGQRQIDTLSRAASLVGTRALYDLAVGVAALGVFQRLPPGVIDASSLWRHSLYSALLARDLARRCHVLHPERLFVAGLLHEVGALVLGLRLPEPMREAVQAARGSEEALAREEAARLGYDHAEVGARLLERWHLPRTTTEAIRHHHHPAEAERLTLEIAIVHLADALANEAQTGWLSAGEPSPVTAHPAAWAITGLAPEVAEDLHPELQPEFDAAIEVLRRERR